MLVQSHFPYLRLPHLHCGTKTVRVESYLYDSRRLRRRTEAQCESSLAFGLRVPIAICLYHSPPSVSLRPLLSCFLSCCLLVSTARVVSPTSSANRHSARLFSPTLSAHTRIYTQLERNTVSFAIFIYISYTYTHIHT